MNSRERFLSALDLDTPDRVPVFYQHLGGARHVLDASGLTIREGFQDPAVFAKICLQARRLFGYDNVMAGWGDLLTEAQAHGSVWRFPERDFYPQMERHVVQDLADVDKLRPVDPLEDRFWSVPLKAGGILKGSVGKEVAVIGSIVSPFFLASELRGYENLLMDTFAAPEAVEKMTEVATASLKTYGERAAALGLDAVFVDDSSASESMLPPEMSERFDVRHLKELVDRYKELGLRTIIHNDAQQPFVDMQIATGAACSHFNNDCVDLAEMFEKHRGKVCLMAGINHQELMFKKSPQEVEAAVRSTIDLYGKEPGLIIAPGCEVPFKSPLENIVMLRQACEKHGRY